MADLRPSVSGVLGAVVLGLFITAVAFEGFIACLFGQGFVFAGMLSGFALAWWVTRCVKRVQLRIFSRAAVAGILFTPYLPIASLQWSSPWPPAAFWLFVGSRKADVVAWMAILICASVGFLWAAGWGMRPGRTKS